MIFSPQSGVGIVGGIKIANLRPEWCTPGLRFRWRILMLLKPALLCHKDSGQGTRSLRLGALGRNAPFRVISVSLWHKGGYTIPKGTKLCFYGKNLGASIVRFDHSESNIYGSRPKNAPLCLRVETNVHQQRDQSLVGIIILLAFLGRKKRFEPTV